MTHPLDNPIQFGVSLMIVVFVTFIVGVSIVNYVLLGSITPPTTIAKPITYIIVDNNFTYNGGGHAAMKHINNCHHNTTPMTLEDIDALCWYKDKICIGV